MKDTLSKIRKSARNQSSQQAPPAKPGGGKAVDARIYAEKVEKRAYELYEKKGRQGGRDWEDWFEAQKMVEAEMISGK